jgi:hypothetical protein
MKIWNGETENHDHFVALAASEFLRYTTTLYKLKSYVRMTYSGLESLEEEAIISYFKILSGIHLEVLRKTTNSLFSSRDSNRAQVKSLSRRA